MYSTLGDSKAVVAERFIGTLRGMLAKKFTENQSYNWTKILPSVVKFYNDKYHKTLKMSPREASDDSNSLQIFLQHQSRSTKSPKQKRPMFSVGDQVRISRIKGTFEKGSEISWSHEIFTIEAVLDTDPVTYKLKDYDDAPITGSFYAEELQKTKIPDYFLIEKIVDEKKVGKKKMYLVKYKGYSDKHNSWLPANQVTDILK